MACQGISQPQYFPVPLGSVPGQSPILDITGKVDHFGGEIPVCLGVKVMDVVRGAESRLLFSMSHSSSRVEVELTDHQSVPDVDRLQAEKLSFSLRKRHSRSSATRAGDLGDFGENHPVIAFLQRDIPRGAGQVGPRPDPAISGRDSPETDLFRELIGYPCKPLLAGGKKGCVIKILSREALEGEIPSGGSNLDFHIPKREITLRFLDCQHGNVLVEFFG